ncbi:drug resistance transporter EmrB/QacA subfamily [Corynascus similis CBS 632.67]
MDVTVIIEPSAVVDTESEYMEGWRLYMLTAGIWIATFLSTLETTVVSTSLVSIADTSSGFDERNWVVTATAFLVIYAKLASIFGSKTMFLFALTFFTIFSFGCGIVRAFQGIGGSGIYMMALVIAPEFALVTEYGKYIGIISSVFATTNFTGPWNGPPGALAILIIAIFLPASKADSDSTFTARLRANFSQIATRRVDFIGAVSLLAASVLLVFALESGGTRYEWNSGPIISTLALSGLLWMVFIIWEIYLERTGVTQEPIFQMGLLKNRQLASITTFLIGFPFVTILFIIPQHAKVVYGLSSVQASLTVLPLLLTSPVATAASGVLTSNFNVPPSYLILVGSLAVWARQYGYEAIMGVGFGLTLSTVLTLGQLLVRKEDAGVVMGALTQVRVLGGTVALAICSAVLSNHLRHNLVEVITLAEFQEIAESLGAINKLGPERVARVRLEFAEGYRRQFQLLTGFSGAALLAALFLSSGHPITVRDVAKQREESLGNSPGSASEVYGTNPNTP